MKCYVDQDKSKQTNRKRHKVIKRNLKDIIGKKPKIHKTFLKILHSKTKHEPQALALLTAYGWIGWPILKLTCLLKDVKTETLSGKDQQNYTL